MCVVKILGAGLVLLSGLLVQGCLVDGESSKEKVRVGKEKGFTGKEKGFTGKEKGFTGKEKGLTGKEKGLADKEKGLTGKDTAFDKCLQQFTSDPIRDLKIISGNKVYDDYLVEKFYRHKKCVELYVGMYGSKQRYVMRGSPVAGGLFRSRTAGSFDAARRFLDRNGITCKQKNGMLALVFPVGKEGHSDYKDIELDCRQARQFMVKIGLDDDEPPSRLAVTITAKKEYEDIHEEIRNTVYDAFDTDEQGIIKKHVRVIGAGGREEVLLDNYELQD